MKTGSIYIITNSINDKVYIGQTTMSIDDRWKSHLKPSTLKQKGSYKLYNAMNKYGKENFSCKVLETNIPVEELNDKEIYYIEQYDSFYNGYNSTKGGDGRVINNDYDIDEIVSQYLAGNSTRTIAKQYNVHSVTIERVLRAQNIVLRPDGSKLSDDMLDNIISLTHTHTYKEIAEIYKVNEKTIRRFLIKHGFRQRKIYKSRIN